MLEIGQLYADGLGVPRDQTEAQSWFAKAEACQGKSLDWIRQRAAAYRDKATAGHLPAFPPTALAAVARPWHLPAVQPATGAGSAAPRTAGPSLDSLVAGIAAIVAIAVAADILSPSSNSSGDPNSFLKNIDQQNADMADQNFHSMQNWLHGYGYSPGGPW